MVETLSCVLLRWRTTKMNNFFKIRLQVFTPSFQHQMTLEHIFVLPVNSQCKLGGRCLVRSKVCQSRYQFHINFAFTRHKSYTFMFTLKQLLGILYCLRHLSPVCELQLVLKIKIHHSSWQTEMQATFLSVLFVLCGFTEGAHLLC